MKKLKKSLLQKVKKVKKIVKTKTIKIKKSLMKRSEKLVNGIYALKIKEFFKVGGIGFAILFFLGISVAYGALTFSGTSISGDGSILMDTPSFISIGTGTSTGVTVGKVGTTTTFPGNVLLQNLSGTNTQCLHADSTGLISGTGADCGSGGGVTATNLAGGIAGQIPYQTAAGATGFRTPNAPNGPVVLDGVGFHEDRPCERVFLHNCDIILVSYENINY